MSKLIRVVGGCCCLIMLASFVAFANETNSEATNKQVSLVDASQRQQPKQHSEFRVKIDDANEVLATPFVWITAKSSSQWVKHGVTLLCGLLFYGLFLFWVARAIPKGKAEEPSVWQA